MSHDIWLAVFLIVIGVFFAIHCFRAGRRELRTGIADSGEYGTYRRGEKGFALIVAMTFAASVMGVIFAGVGIAALLASILALPTP